jgi:hypothetical protein
MGRRFQEEFLDFCFGRRRRQKKQFAMHGGAVVRLLENPEWVVENFGGCDLKHVKRNERLQIVANHLLAAPEASLPQQNNWSDLKAAYRLFQRPEVTFDAVAQCHWQRIRNTAPGRYLCISDTTDIDHTTHPATTGLSILGNGFTRGVRLHSCLVVDSSLGTVEGQAGALLNYRRHPPENETRAQRLRRPREGEIWGHLVAQVGTPPAGCQWVHIFDRGGDNFEALCHVVNNQCDWIIRAGQLHRTVFDSNGNLRALREAIQQAEELGGYELFLRSRPGQAARTAAIQISQTRVTLTRPAAHSPYVKNCGLTQIETNVVVVQEINAPRKVKPICWVLMTSLPVKTFDDAWQVISDYEHRWLIEEYHKVLKTGCRIERHALRTADRLEPLIGLISVIGVRLFQLQTYAKVKPQTKASRRVPLTWLKALKLLCPKISITGLGIGPFFRELAKLGGFLGRKHDGEPGWQTIWRGFEKLQTTIKILQASGRMDRQNRG